MRQFWKDRRPLILIAVVSLVFFSSFQNCSQQTRFIRVQSTTVGNPMTPGTQKILFSICSAVSRCHPQVSLRQCEDGVLATSGLSTPLGLKGSYTIYSTIVEAEQKGEIRPEDIFVESCSNPINSVSCTDPVVQGAYDETAANPFAGVVDLVADYPMTCGNVFVPEISQWQFVDGASDNGINVDPSRNAQRPHMVAYNSDLYAAWAEVIPNNGAQLRVKRFDGTSWISVDGANGIANVVPGVDEPHLISFDNKLFVAWSESAVGQIRVKSYDSVQSWVAQDGGVGLNFNSAKSAGEPNFAVFNSELYVAFSEAGTTPSSSHIRVKKYAGGGVWTFVDSGGANGLAQDPDDSSSAPQLAVHNNKLYLGWTERLHGTSVPFARVAVYGGAGQWNLVDGGQQESTLGDAPAYRSTAPHLVSFNAKLYVIWSVSDAAGNRVRVKVYNDNDSSPQWTPAVSGVLNRSTAATVKAAKLIVFNNKLYATWLEFSFGKLQARVAVYGGNDSAPLWTFVDGNQANGLNFNPAKPADFSHWIVHKAKLFGIWQELNTNGFFQIRVISGE